MRAGCNYVLRDNMGCLMNQTKNKKKVNYYRTLQGPVWLKVVIKIVTSALSNNLQYEKR